MKRILVAIGFVMAASGIARAQCPDFALEEIAGRIAECVDACRLNENSDACEGAHYMQRRAAIGDVSGVRDGYVLCRANAYDHGQIASCNWYRPLDLLAAARKVLPGMDRAPEGSAAPASADAGTSTSAEITSGQNTSGQNSKNENTGTIAAETTSESAANAAVLAGNAGTIRNFPVAVKLEADAHNRRVLHARLEFPVAGSLQELRLDFFRNERQTWLVSTEQMKITSENGKTIVEMSFWDRLRENVAELNYRVEGFATLKTAAPAR